eukprot:CAMPEP_0178397750 /NCGR_PEP_ID=MMETSP0689_2-20121128/14411_1 /TAXON_ID=160604 /ORGANISM="Amphidinium massartii, Strain CS-259" /LENGTH=255 /DNA_ID=CAMNT_0020018477 /DNA_START=53 /DNA_END=817 /DNA_ORIENTATION=+
MAKIKGPLRGTSMYVDNFSKPASDDATPRSLYFLTHCHTDHMAGLRENWAAGPLYCSTLTAKFLRLRKMASPRVIHERPLDQSFEVIEPLTRRRVTVTFLDANHCPGSVVIVFEGLRRGSIIHTGDFRYSESLERSPVLQRITSSRSLDRLYLDATWAHEAFLHLPEKADSIAQLLDLIDQHGDEPILLESHGLGDEEMLAAVSRRFPHTSFFFTDPKRLAEIELVDPKVVASGKFASFDPRNPTLMELAAAGGY